MPIEVNCGSTIYIGDELFLVENVFDCPNSPEKLEVIWHILIPFEVESQVLFEADFFLPLISIEE